MYLTKVSSILPYILKLKKKRVISRLFCMIWPVAKIKSNIEVIPCCLAQYRCLRLMNILKVIQIMCIYIYTRFSLIYILERNGFFFLLRTANKSLIYCSVEGRPEYFLYI